MSQTRKMTAILAVALFIVSPAFSGDTPPEIQQRMGSGNPVAGKEKSSLCQGCHGEDGNSAVPNFPRLSGQYSIYIQRQISNFQQGSRKDPNMTEMAATISNPKDLNDIAAYFASQKMMSGTPITNGTGEKIFREYGCLNCHGEVGKGKPADNPIFPIIGGQHKDYLVKQINDFKTGERDTDMSGTMSDLANRMTDAEIDAVAEYLSGQ